jgi:hypothetical protein
MVKCTGCILLATLLYSNATVLTAAPEQECPDHETLAKLITNPDTYHDKSVWVVAYTTIEFEYMTACPSENDTEIQNCLWLNIDDGPYKTDEDYARYESKLQTWQQFHRETVAIRATFDKTLNGHFSMWPGTLRNVTEVLMSLNGCTTL